MKRKYLVSLSLLFLLSVFVFSKTLTVWLTGVNNEVLNIYKDLVDESFTAKTGIEVRFTNLSWGDFENRFILAAASGEAPDVGGMGPLFAPELGIRGAVIDLKATFDDFDEVTKNLYPAVFRSLSYQGSVFGVHYDANFSMTGFQRDDILQQHGVGSLETWEEVRRALPKLQANGSNLSLAWQLSTDLYEDANMFMWQHGGDDYTSDLKASGYYEPEAIRGFTEYVELYTKYNIDRASPVVQAFSDGSLFYFIQQPPWYSNLLLAHPQLQGKWSIVQVPGTLRDGVIHRESSVAGNALSIFKTSEMKEEAWDFIKWIISEPIQVEIATRTIASSGGHLALPADLNAITKVNLPERDILVYQRALEEGTTSVYGLVAPRHRRRYLQFAAEEAILMNVPPEEALMKYAQEHSFEIRKKETEYARFIQRMLEEQRK
ncbi:MAG: extracellular solute-binding protein [Firmicutes bacterium]|nr:extracellular solute-binding protein [Bacillota bacterium]MDD4693290.1 extracellular solute-binding protein [Bacillota bacterium]